VTEPESRGREAPTLELNDAIFRSPGGAAALAPAVSLHTDARRVGLVGDWQPLFRALSGQATIASGTARVLGCDLDVALARGVVGFAACDATLPSSFSVREYLEHAARLSHGSRARAHADARRTLDEYGLSELATQKLGRLLPYQSRALSIACAALIAPEVIWLEAPLRDLDAASADYVARLCAHAATRSRLIVSAALPSTPSPERTLLDDCAELFVMQHGTLVAEGPPETVFAPSARFLVSITGVKASEFAGALTGAGCRLTQQTNRAAFGALLATSSRVTRYLVELPQPASPDLVLDTALEQGVTVLELEPLFGAQTLASRAHPESDARGISPL
jgi:ABC-type multidrug transport system ATPase subunit